MQKPVTHRILIVENDLATAQELEQRLIALHYTVAGIAPEGSQAIHLATQSLPDLVLMEFPVGSDHQDLATAIRIKEQFQLPIVFLASEWNGSTLPILNRAGADGFLVKPFADQQLTATIEIAIARHQTGRNHALPPQDSSMRDLFACMNEMVVLHELVQDSAGKTVDYRILDCNEAFIRITGITKERAVGSLASQLYDRNPAPYLEVYAKVATSGTPARFETFYAPMEKHFIISVFSPAKNRFATVASDITERKHYEHELERIGRLYAVLSQVNQSLVKSQTREEIFHNVCHAAVEEGKFALAWIGWLDKANRQIVPVAQYGDEGGYLKDFACNEEPQEENLSVIHTALRERRHVLSDSRSNHSPVSAWQQLASKKGFASSAVFPIYLGHEAMGVFCLYSTEPQFFREKEILLLDEASADISFALNNLEKEAARQRVELALKESEEKFRQLFNSGYDAIFVHGVTTEGKPGTFLEVNDIACDRLGYTREEFYNLTPLDIDVPELQSRGDKIMAALASQGNLVFESAHLAKNGRVIPVEVNTRRFKFQGQILMLSIARDITLRKQADEALRQSEERHRRLFEEAIEGIGLADATTGVIVDCNQAFLNLTGYEKAELVGKSQATLHPPEKSGSPVTHSFNMHRSAEEGLVIKTALVTKQGCLKTVEIKGQKIEIGGRALVQAFFRDLTTTQQYQHERETTLALLRLLNHPSSTMDLLEQVTGWLQEWTGCEAVGIRLQEGEDFPYYVVRGFPRQFVQAENSLCAHDEKGELVRDCQGNAVLECMCGNVIRGRFNPNLPFFTAKGSFWTNSTSELLAGTSETERQTRTRNRCHGEGYESVALIPLCFGGRRLGLLQFNDSQKGRFGDELIAFLERIADQIAIALSQRKSQAALHRNEAELSAIYNYAPMMMCLVDQQHQIHRVNQAVLDASHKTERELLGSRGGDLLGCVYSLDDPRDCGHGPNCLLCPLRMAILDTLKTGQSHKRVEVHKTVLHHGRTQKLALLASVARVEVREQPMVLVCLEDITQLRQVESQYLHAQKMEAIGQLAGGIAHDFNNILAAILMNLSLMKMELSPNTDLIKNLDELESAATRAANLTRQLLVFSRRQIIQKQPLNLNEHLHQTLVMIGRLLGETIQIRFQPGPAISLIEADPGMVDQVIMNLSVNARDAMPKGGTLTIDTREVEFTTQPPHPGARIGRFACLHITDTGTGMDEETLKHIFEPFFTTKDVGKGTGLGLATVYGIVKQHEGWIEVESSPGKGTGFHVFWPVYNLESQSGSLSIKEKLLPHGHETILVVEDEDSVRRATCQLLRNCGYRVLTAANGGEGLLQWQKHQHEISLLFTDMVMPGGISGLELAQLLRQSKPDLKVIITSGYSSEIWGSADQITQLGISFIQKPAEGPAIAMAVHKCLH